MLIREGLVLMTAALILLKVQKQIMDKAREKGADAVVIVGLDRYQSGQQTQVRDLEGPASAGPSRS
ncbi:MAG: hypothetical protein A3G76_00115 [Acidobacteria bacterium RIFCSPLOWO2_12_FULL_65_11]|nr:MAG: hypothetical protein A3H95_15510 [Acidobacteria bacterium RIFCSPLOWO2_02_FULL_64_15]OFW29314.1 MAG: hypothetical protein A3G76_00115 [Acidobacteria bacterium RIFCSPLOWO2_12_FULL_65_11]